LTARFANAGAGLFASGIYLTSFGVLAIGTTALLDSVFSLFISLALGTYWFALAAEDRARRNGMLALCGVACGCAFLTKGFLAAAIPTLVAGAFLAWERRWQELWKTPWIPLAVAVVVSLPWSIAIALREPDFWHYFFFVEHVGRFFSEEAQHAEPWWYYLATLPLLTFPWIFLVPQVFKGLKSEGVDSSFVRYLLCWAILPFAFFSASHGKIVTYILPCMAPFAMLLSLGLERRVSAQGRLNLKWSSLGLAALLAVVLVALAAAQRGAFGEPPYGSTDSLRYGGLLAVLGFAVIAALWAGRSSAAWLQMLLVGGAVLPFYLLITIALPPSVGQERGPSEFLAEHVDAAPDALIVSDASLFGTTSWALQRDDVYVIGGGEIAYGLSYPEDEHRFVDEQSLASLIRANEGSVDIVIFCEDGTEQRILPALPPGTSRTQVGGLVLLRIPAATESGNG
jgi:4-amino-4-deoxy-L-arabinose transferase